MSQINWRELDYDNDLTVHGYPPSEEQRIRQQAEDRADERIRCENHERRERYIAEEIALIKSLKKHPVQEIKFSRCKVMVSPYGQLLLDD